MADPMYCKRCGTPSGPETAHGLCPGCLLEQGLGAAATAAGASHAGPDTTAMPSVAAWSAAGAPIPRAAPELAEMGRLFPQLEVLQILGRGGMGIVYKARQRGLDRMVALKILPPGVDRDPGFQERFLREARALARLNHPNIVAVYDFGQAGGLYYFLMEYVDGVNLRQLLHGQTAERVEPAQALAIVPQVCDALQFAHEEGIVHRDIKPENILLDRKGRVKIADFGLAKLIAASTPAEGARGYSLTATQQVVGTPHYMAPEQFERPATVDHRADIYSLGVVFYELLTGELPLGRFAPPSRKYQLDVRLDDVVLRTLEKQPQDRYQHASDVKWELGSLSIRRTEGRDAMPPSPAASAPPQQLPPLPPLPPLPHAAPRVDRPMAANAGAADAGAADGPPRVSRAAIFGLLWALLALISMFATYSVRSEPVAIGHDGQHVVVQPGRSVAFFPAALLMLFGLAAPFGTTVLGWVAVGHIRRSRGQIYGLPLALLDGLLFPLLLLGGAIHLVWFAIYYGNGQPDPTAALAATLITCAVSHTYIVRRAWRAASAPLPPAQPLRPQVPHARRVGDYQLPPRRSRVAFVLLILILGMLGLLLVGALVMPTLQRPSYVSQPQVYALGTEIGDGYQRYRFSLRGPVRGKATFWLEVWQGGGRLETPGFDAEHTIYPPAQGVVDGVMTFTLHNATPEREGRARATLELTGSHGSSAWEGSFANVFFSMNLRDSSWSPQSNSWTPDVGQDMTLLVLRGGKTQLFGAPADPEMRGRADAEVRLMGRFDALQAPARQGIVGEAARALESAIDRADRADQADQADQADHGERPAGLPAPRLPTPTPKMDSPARIPLTADSSAAEGDHGEHGQPAAESAPRVRPGGAIDAESRPPSAVTRPVDPLRMQQEHRR